MKKFTKIKLLSTTAAIATIFVSSLSYACPANELCDGLNITVNNDRVLNIEGLGGIDLSGVKVAGAGNINVEVPKVIENAIEQSQVNGGDIKSVLDYDGSWIKGDFEAKVNAIANNISIEEKDGFAFVGAQKNTGNVSATAETKLLHLVEIEDVSYDVTAIGNSASYESDGDIILDLAQSNTGDTVKASLDTTLNGQGALRDALTDVNVTAISNNLSVANDGMLLGSISQENCADVNAVAKINISAFKDPINVTAIGNNFQVSNTKVDVQ